MWKKLLIVVGSMAVAAGIIALAVPLSIRVYKMAPVISAVIAALHEISPMENNNRGWYSRSDHKNKGKFIPWECAFERDHVPPIDPEADKLFQEARKLERETYNPTEADRTRIFNLYKQAAEQGHWRAMFNLANCYINGWGTTKNNPRAYEILYNMMRQGIPAGFYGASFLVKRGMGVPYDKVEADKLLHQAADLGSPQAQCDLGKYYTYIEQRDRQGLSYYVCALRQGYAPAGKEIGFRLASEKNPPMAVEYYYRGVKLGDYGSALALEDIFGGESLESGTKSYYAFGYHRDTELSQVFSDYYDQIEADSTRRFPSLFKEHPIPPHPTISREQSRAMSSPLKAAFGGRWPDEIFPELAPDYMPPKY